MAPIAPSAPRSAGASRRRLTSRSWNRADRRRARRQRELEPEDRLPTGSLAAPAAPASRRMRRGRRTGAPAHETSRPSSVAADKREHDHHALSIPIPPGELPPAEPERAQHRELERALPGSGRRARAEADRGKGAQPRANPSARAPITPSGTASSSSVCSRSARETTSMLRYGAPAAGVRGVRIPSGGQPPRPTARPCAPCRSARSRGTWRDPGRSTAGVPGRASGSG